MNLSSSLSINGWLYVRLMQCFGISTAERNMQHQFESISSIFPRTKHKSQRLFESNTLKLDQSDFAKS